MRDLNRIADKLAEFVASKNSKSDYDFVRGYYKGKDRARAEIAIITIVSIVSLHIFRYLFA
jgi:hypothetical protein